jgi:hypothetical protein
MSDITVLPENINAPSGLTKLVSLTINSFVHQVEGDVAESEQRIRVASGLKELAATVVAQIIVSRDWDKIRGV